MIIEACMDGVKSTDNDGIMVVDCHGTDAWMAEAIATMSVEKKKRMFVGTICHEDIHAKLTKHTMGSIVYNACREKKLKVLGFPDYDKMLQDVEKIASTGTKYKQNDAISYEICKPLVDGTLVVLDALVQKFMSFGGKVSDEMSDVLVAHNKEFNMKNATSAEDVKRKRDTENDDQAGAKKLKPHTGSIEEFLAKYSDAITFNEPNGRWAASAVGGVLFESGNAVQTITLQANKECFSFGSGDWLEGPEAVEEMSAADGRWFSFSLGRDSRVLLDAAGLPGSVGNVQFVASKEAVALERLIRCLAVAGDAKINMSGHDIEQASGVLSVNQSTKIAFKLDDNQANQRRLVCEPIRSIIMHF